MKNNTYDNTLGRLSWFGIVIVPSFLSRSPAKQLLAPLDDGGGVGRVGNGRARVKARRSPLGERVLLVAAADDGVAVGRVDLVVAQNQRQVLGRQRVGAVVQIQVLLAGLLGVLKLLFFIHKSWC